MARHSGHEGAEASGSQGRGQDHAGYEARSIPLNDGAVQVPAERERHDETLSPGATIIATELRMGEPTVAADIMTGPVKTASTETDLSAVAALMRDEKVGIVPILDDHGQLAGVVTDRDIVVRADAAGTPAKQVRAGDIMTTKLVTVRPDDEVLDVLERMGREGLHRVLVTDDDERLVGIISISDLARRTDLPERMQDTLDQISRHRG